jgi:Holliday junction resolvase
MSNAAQAISELLKAVGYEVIFDPRTSKGDTDPLLTNLDLFAYNSERAFAIEVKIAQQSEAPVEWSVASRLLMAAFALDSQTQEYGVKSQKVEPMLVLVGGEPTESLKAFCKEELIWLVPISGEEVIRQILAAKNQSDMQGLVHQYLGGIYDVNNVVGFPSGTSSELQGGL